MHFFPQSPNTMILFLGTFFSPEIDYLHASHPFLQILPPVLPLLSASAHIGLQLPQVIKNDLELRILLPLSPECWNHRLAHLVLRIELWALCMQGHILPDGLRLHPQAVKGPSGVPAQMHEPMFLAARSLLPQPVMCSLSLLPDVLLAAASSHSA